jgi:hypothetical protein
VSLNNGIINKSHSTAAFSSISDIHTKQKWNEGLFGYGTLRITTSAGSHHLDFSCLKRPKKVRDFLLLMAQKQMHGEEDASQGRS